MQLRNRKINSGAKHQLKILHLNKQYFENEQHSSRPSNYCSYIDPTIVGCNDEYDNNNSINLQIFLKNIFFCVMAFSMYAMIFTSLLHAGGYNTSNNSYINKYELALNKPNYNKNNLEGLKIVSMVFSTNNIKTKFIISKNIKNLYKSLVKLDNNQHDMTSIYPNWISFLFNYTNTSMFKLDEYIWMKNGSINNSYSLLKYNMHNPYNYVSININRNESIYNTNFYPYLIIL